MAGRISGTVKWFSRDKGCGVITPDSGEDIFVSNDRVRSHEFRTLTNGQRVSFLVRETPKGREADDVVPA